MFPGCFTSGTEPRIAAGSGAPPIRLTAGLVLDQIEDIVEENVAFGDEPPRDLLQGSAVIRERVADVLNVKAVLARVRELAPLEQWSGACTT